MDWQPIETAPTNGTDVILLIALYDDDRNGYMALIGRFDGGFWVDSHEEAEADKLHRPRGWSPIPELP